MMAGHWPAILSPDIRLPTRRDRLTVCCREVDVLASLCSAPSLGSIQKKRGRAACLNNGLPLMGRGGRSPQTVTVPGLATTARPDRRKRLRQKASHLLSVYLSPLPTNLIAAIRYSALDVQRLLLLR